MAYRAGVPVLPTFITMTADERLGADGYPIQRFTFHVMPPIYPDKTLGEKVGAEKMRDEAYALCKAKYEEVYKIPLVYGEPDESEESPRVDGAQSESAQAEKGADASENVQVKSEN